MSTTYEEWRVIGDPGPGYPPYEFTWSRLRQPDRDPEEHARGFMALAERTRDRWADGPYLQRRTVTVTDWQPVR